MLRKSHLLTQSGTKRVTAAALAAAIARNEWSNADAGEALGCSEGTIRNRLDTGTADKQMPVHELRRSIVVDGPEMANAILADINHRVVPVHCETAPDALAAAGAAARCAADIIAAAPDGFDPDEAKLLLPAITRLQHELAGLEAHLRSIAAAAT